MTEDISIDIIKNTQMSLGDFIKKPPLTEKLLRKPPFRYLHDIIMAIMKNTGFFNGLFSEKEMISENVKERDDKIKFLQKVIDVVNMVTQTEIQVRPTRIIAGHEPEKTNVLLQKIGEALKQNLGSEEAVYSILNGSKAIVSKKADKPNKDNKAEIKRKSVAQLERKEKPRETEKNRDLKKTDTNSKQQQKEPKKNISSKKLERTSNVDEKNPIRKSLKNNGGSHKIETSNPKLLSNTKKFHENNISVDDSSSIDDSKKIISFEENEISKEENAVIENKTIERVDNSESKIIETSTKLSIVESGGNEDVIMEKQEIESDGVIKSAEKTSIERRNTINESVKSSPERLMKHKSGSAKNKSESKIKENVTNEKNKPPFYKEEIAEQNIPADKINGKEELIMKKNQNDEISIVRPKTSLRPPSVRPSSSRPGAPRFKETNIDTIITTGIPKEKVKIIVEDYDKLPEGDESSIIIETLSVDNIANDVIDRDISSATNKGHLVEQILATQKELSGNTQKVDIEWEWGTRQEREMSYKEVEILKNSLQSLSRVANPLGKLVEHVQEDAEIMRQELLQWKEVRKIASEKLNQQESLDEKMYQPLEIKLKSLNENIMDQLELINTVKSNIRRNNQKIKHLIGGNSSNY